jgi:hypothetical protein
MVALDLDLPIPSSVLSLCAQAYKRHTYANQQSNNSGGDLGRLGHHAMDRD